MGTLRRSPLFRIALLSLAVLFAHTLHATDVQRIVSAGLPCAAKVAVAQPDPEKKLVHGTSRIVRPRFDAGFHRSSGGDFSFTVARAADLLFPLSACPKAVSPQIAYSAPQRWPFVLRI
jgi:hypothetical protein